MPRLVGSGRKRGRGIVPKVKGHLSRSWRPCLGVMPTPAGRVYSNPVPCGFSLLEDLIVLCLKCSQFHKVDDSKMYRLFKVNVSGVPAPNLCSPAMGCWLFRPGLSIKTKGSLPAKKEPSVWKEGEEPRNQQPVWTCVPELGLLFRKQRFNSCSGEGRPKACYPTKSLCLVSFSLLATMPRLQARLVLAAVNFLSYLIVSLNVGLI